MSTDLVHRPGYGMTLVQFWEAFGVSDDDNNPKVRKSGDPTMFPDGELSGDPFDEHRIHSVRVSVYGDHIAGGFVKVVGTDPVTVRIAWHRAAKIANELGGKVFP